MAFSFLVKIDTNASDVETSTDDFVEVGDGANSSRARRNRIEITLNGENAAYNQLQGAIGSNGKFKLQSLSIIPSNQLKDSTGRKWVRTGGKLSYNDKPIEMLNGKGKRTKQKATLDSRSIFKGYYEYDIPVAIQRIVLCMDLLKEIEREFQILRQLNNHENLIRYYCHETDGKDEFVFIANELCSCSVEDLYEPDQLPADVKQPILESLKTKDILFQATTGLDYLHRNHFVHRNVKPSSFLVKEVFKGQYVVKISDFRLSRPVDPKKNKDLSGTIASKGWIAPESCNENQLLHPSIDVFILGCFFYYVLTGKEGNPLHPFGASDTSRITNITNPKFDVSWSPLDDPQATDLLKRMIEYDETKRPNLFHVLNHPYFQKSSSKEFYPMYEYKKPGLCVIFNQELFLEKKRNRTGSTKDCSLLKETFDSLGYVVEVYQNLRAYELEETLSQLAMEDFSSCGSLIVCLLSHGDEGTVEGTDGIPVNINKLKYKFGFTTCPSLYGKPKIFIIQACQGSLMQTMFGHELLPGSGPTMESLMKSVIGNSLNEEQGGNYIVTTQGPPFLDFITIKSTLPGFLSFRNTETGTYFIRALCAKLNEEYVMKKGKKDLEELLRGDDGVQSLTNRSILHKERRQTIQWEVCLSKYIRFSS